MSSETHNQPAPLPSSGLEPVVVVTPAKKPRIRSEIATILLTFAAGFFIWFMLNWSKSFTLIHIPSQKVLYLSWIVLQIVGTVLFGAGMLALFKARLWWSRVLFPFAILIAAAAVQAAAVIVFARALPDHEADRFLWLGDWITPRVLTCMWASVGITAGAALVAMLIAATLTRRDGTFADFKTIVRNWFKSLLVSPNRLFFGPIFIKDVRVAGRRTGTYWTRMLYPVALLGLISIIYFSMTSMQRYTPSNAQRLDDLQQVAPALAVGIGWFQIILLHVLAAAMTASAVCDEKRSRTLSALMTTPMTSAQIVLGKLTSRMSQLLIVALISAPFLLAVRIFGGLDAEYVLAMTAITITSSIFMASLGVLFSIWCKKPANAAAMAVFAFLAITIGPLLVVLLAFLGSNSRSGGPPDELLVISSPMAMGVVTAQVFGGELSIELTQLWTINSGLNLVFAGITSLIAAGALRRVMLSDPAPPAPKKPRRVRKLVRRSAVVPVASGAVQPTGDELIFDSDVAPDPGAAANAVPSNASAAEPPLEEIFVERDREVWDRPVLWRELRQPTVGSRRNLVVASLVAVAGLLWLYSNVPPSEPEAHPLVVVLMIVIFCVAAAIATTSSITGEKEASTWMVLLTTPLKPFDILFAKMLGAIRKHWFLSSVLAAHLVIGIIAGGIHPVLILQVAMIFISVAVLLAGTGVLMSLLVKRPLAAMLLNLFFAGGIWIGVPTIGLLVSQFLFRRGSNERTADVVMAINPVFMAATAATGVNRPGPVPRLPVAEALPGMSIGLGLALVALLLLSSRRTPSPERAGNGSSGRMVALVLLWAAAGAFLLRGLRQLWSAGSTGRRPWEFRYRMPSGMLGAWEFTGIVAGVSVLGIVVGLAALLIACRMFPRYSGRSS